jgi:hypothetical protein
MLNFNEYYGDFRKLILSSSSPTTLAALLKYPSTIFRKVGYVVVGAGDATPEKQNSFLAILDASIPIIYYTNIN